VCPSDGDCEEAVDAIQEGIPGSVVAVSPSTTPAVTVPLGWSLSAFSRSRLRVESDQQRRCGRDAAYVDHEYDFKERANALDVDAGPCKSSGAYGRFGVFLNLFDSAQPPQ
jgi:hypothetical protein